MGRSRSSARGGGDGSGREGSEGIIHLRRNGIRLNHFRLNHPGSATAGSITAGSVVAVATACGAATGLGLGWGSLASVTRLPRKVDLERPLLAMERAQLLQAAARKGLGGECFRLGIPHRAGHGHEAMGDAVSKAEAGAHQQRREPKARLAHRDSRLIDVSGHAQNATIQSSLAAAPGSARHSQLQVV